MESHYFSFTSCPNAAPPDNSIAFNSPVSDKLGGDHMINENGSNIYKVLVPNYNLKYIIKYVLYRECAKCCFFFCPILQQSLVITMFRSGNRLDSSQKRVQLGLVKKPRITGFSEPLHWVAWNFRHSRMNDKILKLKSSTRVRGRGQRFPTVHVTTHRRISQSLDIWLFLS